MEKTKKVGKRRNLRKKQNSRRVRGKGRDEYISRLLASKLNDVHLRTYKREFTDPQLVSYIFSLSLSDKDKYERRLREALILNKKILSDQEASIKQLKMSGIDGPSTRTRNKGRHTTDPVLEDLELEAYHTKQAIMQIEHILSRIETNPTYMPYGFTSYGEFLRERPGWDMPRMTYTTRFRPPGYPNWR